ncbi:MAG: alpha-L-fucosidase [bacterium]|nr:alpha-L-fucosidase [bacterium]
MSPALPSPGRILMLTLLLALPGLARSGGEPAARPHPDPLVQRKLDWFQDQKLGLLMHWGTYSQWGVVESWSICPEDEDWTRRRGPHAHSYTEYVAAYEALKATFNPLKFDPAAWAAAARGAGMRYVVFTTKHHDGFCLFDTRETDYKVTDPGCPFSRVPRANVAREVFTAFRREGLGTGAYFSKADWHCPDYWWPYFPPFDRNVNYDITRYPEKWEAFKTFTRNQIRELMSDYGPMDILWLDGGWVQPMTATSPRWGKAPSHQDIDMAGIAAMARALQPGLIIVDRAVEGDHQDYHTPEQEVPEQPLDAVWESCITLGTSWSWVPDDDYKSAERLVHLLVDIVAKGGNLLLNVGPSPQGEWPDEALARLAELGAWLEVNGAAIHGTRAVAPYKEGRVCYTRSPDGVVNAILLASAAEPELPATLHLPAFVPGSGQAVRLLGVEEELRWEPEGAGCRIHVPEAVRRHPPCRHAWSFQLAVE